MVIKGRRGVIVSDCWVSQILLGSEESCASRVVDVV